MRRAPLALLLPCACAPQSAVEPDPFADVTAELGIAFRHDSGAAGALLFPEIMGGGCAVFDANGDGRLDLVFVNSATDHALYLQDTDGRFRDAGAGSGLTGREEYGMGCAVGDVDNDGDLDLFVTAWGTDQLFLNDGAGRFQVATEEWGAGVGGWSTSAAFLDFDRDGWLDLYVTRYVEFVPGLECFDRAGRREYCGPEAMPPVHDVLLRNTGLGRFEDVSESAGITTKRAAGLGVVVEDLDGDGLCDVIVANDAYANHLWRNQGDGTFREEGVRAGIALNNHGHTEAGMGIVAEDLDADGVCDLFLTHLANETNTLYRGVGPAVFRDETGQRGLAASVRTTGFGVCALDLENDGDLDLAIANGRVVAGEELQPGDFYSEPNLLFRNAGGGAFELSGSASFGARLGTSRALACGDLDRDGDVDLVLVEKDEPARVFENRAGAGHWLAVRAVDPRFSRATIGARIRVGNLRRTLRSASSYLAAGPLEVHFGLGERASVEDLEVLWPDGLRERFPCGEVDRVVTVERGAGEAL